MPTAFVAPSRTARADPRRLCRIRCGAGQLPGRRNHAAAATRTVKVRAGTYRSAFGARYKCPRRGARGEGHDGAAPYRRDAQVVRRARREAPGLQADSCGEGLLQRTRCRRELSSPLLVADVQYRRLGHSLRCRLQLHLHLHLRRAGELDRRRSRESHPAEPFERARTRGERCAGAVLPLERGAADARCCPQPVCGASTRPYSCAGQATADNLAPHVAQIDYMVRTDSIAQADIISSVMDNNAEAAAKVAFCRWHKTWVTKSRGGSCQSRSGAGHLSQSRTSRGAARGASEAIRVAREIQTNLGLEPLETTVLPETEQLIDPQECERQLRAMMPAWQQYLDLRRLHRVLLALPHRSAIGRPPIARGTGGLCLSGVGGERARRNPRND